ncbi:MAG: hypothetical protein AAFO69_12610, partial [Bacteroidota bacterium]
MKGINYALLLFVCTLLGYCSSSGGADGVILLNNDHLGIAIKKQGAELISILRLDDGTQYLWQGDTTTWQDHAIIQFPIIGNLKNDSYQLDGASYKMMSHGFARISQFKVIEHTASKAVLELNSSSETRQYYPFDFTFTVSYE